MTVEVRCCCNPQNLLGWVELPERLVRHGFIRLACRVEWDARREAVVEGRRYLETTIERYLPGGANPLSWLALTSAEQPIEVWRTVSGFTENLAGDAQAQTT
jgi:hypothetical protein